MQERRKFIRHRILKGARIALTDECAAAIDCVARNISEGGACLAIADPRAVPDDFDLIFDSGYGTRHCRVVWRTESRIGVEFRPQSAAHPASDGLTLP